jgi:hypothetical protein
MTQIQSSVYEKKAKPELPSPQAPFLTQLTASHQATGLKVSYFPLETPTSQNQKYSLFMAKGTGRVDSSRRKTMRMRA